MHFPSYNLINMAKDLSLIIPAFNEEERIGRTLKTAAEYLTGKYDFDIIVVDDGSSDKTCDVVETFNRAARVVRQPRNMGKGAAVRRGMLESDAAVRIFSDADLSVPVYELPRLYGCLKNGNDVCIGSRAIDYSMIKKHQPFYREMMGRTFNHIVQALVLKGIKDTQCGFKGFTAKAAETIFPETKIDGFGFDVEILYLAKKSGLNIKELPVEWYNDERSTVSPFADSLKMLKEIISIKKLHSNK